MHSDFGFIIPSVARPNRSHATMMMFSIATRTAITKAKMRPCVCVCDELVCWIGLVLPLAAPGRLSVSWLCGTRSTTKWTLDRMAGNDSSFHISGFNYSSWTVFSLWLLLSSQSSRAKTMQLDIGYNYNYDYDYNHDHSMSTNHTQFQQALTRHKPLVWTDRTL